MGLESFKSYMTSTKEDKKANTDVWLYTRVSSKDQEVNKSLENQKEAGYKHAKEHGYNITNTFGGTYESASGDFTRKEFSKLIQEIRDAKKKPFAVLIYTMSRFSRTGGNGIALANELVEGLGVNLIEVSTGKSTITPEGKLEIFSSLIKANQENLDRLRVTIPGMKALLRSGSWLGVVPLGYSMYGPRVKNRKLYREKQEIVINEIGEKLRDAWQWKLQGEKDFEIIRTLSSMGIHISKQKLSAMWRNPFYCGISVNKMLEEPVKGSWEGMVTEDEFWEVQDILKGNNFGFKQDKANPARPLNAFLHCSECGGRLTGYEVKKKQVHYYKCQTCIGATINANTTKMAKADGAHNLFEDLLKTYELKEGMEELYEIQLTRTYNVLNTEKEREEAEVKRELEKHENELKTLKRKYALGDIEKDLYEEVKDEISSRVNEITKNMRNVSRTISNLNEYIECAKDVASNAYKYWVYGDLPTKKGIQETVFPDGVIIDVKKRVYLTKKTNLVFDASRSLSINKGAEMKNGNRNFLLPSSVVEGTLKLSNRISSYLAQIDNLKNVDFDIK